MTAPNQGATSDDDSSQPSSAAVGRVRVPSARPAVEPDGPAGPQDGGAEGRFGDDSVRRPSDVGGRPSAGGTGRASVPEPRGRAVVGPPTEPERVGRAAVPMPPPIEDRSTQGRVAVPAPVEDSEEDRYYREAFRAAYQRETESHPEIHDEARHERYGTPADPRERYDDRSAPHGRQAPPGRNDHPAPAVARASVPQPRPPQAQPRPPQAPPRPGEQHYPRPPTARAADQGLGSHPSRGTAKVGAFEDTGTFRTIDIADYERADLTAEERARRISSTGSFPQVQIYDYERFSELSGEIQQAPQGEYKVQYRKLPGRRPVRTLLLSLFTFGLEVGFFSWLIVIGAKPQQFDPGNQYIKIAAIVLVVTTVLVEGFRLVSIVSLVIATLNSRNPIPVWPDPNLRVAFLTTIVPGKEPVEMVEHTLKAALKIRHRGKYDVWLLDEGDDDEVKAMCARVGVNHFSRRGVQPWNTGGGPHKAKTKHGNYNAWIIQHGADYDVFVSVDPDHAPLPNYCERMLGYFRDPDVAFIVGPQVYGNFDNVLTKSAESQQYMFHAVIQRAGNRYEVPMLVGTNNAVRISAVMGIHGMQDSITEDFATGLLLHGERNPNTGKRWKSVYTPDVLAVGEGPSSWTDFFTQQHRWSRGTHEILLQPSFPRLMFRLGIKRMFFYTILMVYYPLTALTWVLGALNAVLELVFGIKGIYIPFDLWLMLYVDAGLMQVVLCLWNRRHNVSPHEAPGSTGLTGMFITLVCAPVYASSFIGSVFRRRTGFVITPKGQSATADRFLTFRKNLQWAVFYGVLLGLGAQFGRFNTGMWYWSSARMLLCLAPIVMWKLSRSGRRKTKAVETLNPPQVPVREMETAA